MKNNIKQLGYFLVSIFVILILYLSYVVVQQGEALATHPQNRRLAAREAAIIRGTIFDRQGTVLAETQWDGHQGKRVYRMEGTVSPFAQVIGYVSDRYGSAGLEASYGKELLGLTDADAIENLLDKILNRTSRGNDLVLTLDATLQKVALEALKGRKGAVVALDPRDGSILAMVSSPAYNTNAIGDAKVWDQLNGDELNAPLLNRAAQGAYAPGSVIKLVTGAGLLEQQKIQPQDTIQCPGYTIVDGYKMVDNRAHGTVDFNKALALSCNTYFAQGGMKLGWKGFLEQADRFGLTAAPEIGLPVRAGTLAAAKRQTQSQLAETSFGQGDTLISPLHMAMVGSAIAHQGMIMKPYLVQAVRKPDGTPVRSMEPAQWLRATTPEVAAQITQGMISSVEWGTATAAAIPGVKVAGKTGTAETKSEKDPNSLPHAWFVGFAPADQPSIALAVVVEKAGSGAVVAAPIAREVMAAALKSR
ncbi:penicillin-binding transpeptidase domain-containing protein [Desulforamulus ruminis]|uniref:peptidoglycan D,D-transpeptidase FtsI family protein n=1 Tax=Desulforamulus ruminis TaxID=1564 RepID=UPI002FDAC6F2